MSTDTKEPGSAEIWWCGLNTNVPELMPGTAHWTEEGAKDAVVRGTSIGAHAKVLSGGYFIFSPTDLEKHNESHRQQVKAEILEELRSERTRLAIPGHPGAPGEYSDPFVYLAAIERILGSSGKG